MEIATMPARLTIHFPELPAQRFLLEEGPPYRVGRGEDCDVCLEDGRVSRHHARLSGRPEGWHLEHLGSKNGLEVDGIACAAGEAVRVLGADSWISFGGLLAHFEVISESARAAAAQSDLRRWQTSLQLQARLDPARGLDQLLHQVLASIQELSGAERAFLMLVDPDGEPRLAVTAGLAAEELEAPAFQGSLGAVERTLERGVAVTLADAWQDAELGRRHSVLAQGIRALVCLPLVVMERVLGVIYADSRQAGSVFTDLDVEILSAMASHAALAIAVARVQEEVEGVRRALPEGASVQGAVRREESTALARAWSRMLPTFRSRGDRSRISSNTWSGFPS